MPKEFHSKTLAVDDFKILLGPGVYIVRDKNQVALYVGSSVSLIRRLGCEAHASLLQAVSEGDHVEVIPVPSIKVARELEMSIIADEQPKYNIIGKRKTPYSLVGAEDFS